MESVAFTYNGSNECVATITNAVPATQYSLRCGDPNSSVFTDTAVGTTLVLTVSDIGGYVAGGTFDAQVEITASSNVIGCTVLEGGVSGEFPFYAIWTYDGVNTFTVRGVFPVLTIYFACFTVLNGGSTTFVGTGLMQTVSQDVAATGTPVVGETDNVYCYIEDDATGDFMYSNRLFVPDEADSSFSGNPLAGVQYQRIFGWRLNISDDALETVDPLMTSPQGG